MSAKELPSKRKDSSDSEDNALREQVENLQENVEDMQVKMDRSLSELDAFKTQF